LRIVGGKYRSRVLKDFAGNEIRPTADKVKESLFNILSDVANKSFLDLFAGTGGVGLEALSRGAGKVTFVDVRKESLDLTKQNVKLLGETAQTVLSDSIEFLKRTKDKYDVIFIDPPYKTDLGIKALEVIADKNLLTDDGIAIFESETPFTGKIKALSFYDERKYGRTYLSFFKNKKPACVFAGTFDPITNGHIDIVNKAKIDFAKVYVTIMVNPNKTPLFSLEDRLKFLNTIFKNDEQVVVEYYSGYAAEYVKSKGTTYYVRGFRNEADLVYEQANERLSKAIFPELNTVYVKASKNDRLVSSTAVRDALSSQTGYEKFIPKEILPLITDIIKKQNN
jgi:16S rRNA (guanine(966)-N(2))-methyltransferase RsmD/pantetheine-phosphate adenylyltransferase